MTSTELAAQIAASPRFRGDEGTYFDELAAQYGRDFTGRAFIQAALKADQDAGQLPSCFRAVPQGAGLLGW